MGKAPRSRYPVKDDEIKVESQTLMEDSLMMDSI
jgi:hypothetical protein